MWLSRLQNRSGRLGEEIKLLNLPGLESRTIQPVVWPKYRLSYPGSVYLNRAEVYSSCRKAFDSSLVVKLLKGDRQRRYTNQGLSAEFSIPSLRYLSLFFPICGCSESVSRGLIHLLTGS